MENYLNEFVNFLRENPVDFSRNNSDGRINSAGDEDIIIAKLKSRFGAAIEHSQIRNWYDFAIKIDSRRLFVNVKSSDLTNGAADNLSSKLGMGYALTGIENLPIAWEKFNDLVAENLRVGFDYYFLIANKNNSRDIFWTSLKRIKKLQPNGNNLPFQCDWNKNREFSGRDELSAMRYILEIYVESWDKKTKGYPHKIRELLIHDKLIT